MTHFARQIWKILDIIQKQVAICSKTMKDILVARRELCKELQYSIPDIAPEFDIRKESNNLLDNISTTPPKTALIHSFGSKNIITIN